MRPLEAPTPQIRNVPMRPRAWRELLQTPDATVTQRDSGTLALVPRDGQLHLYWSFDSVEEMRVNFAEMWEELRAALSPERADYVVLNLVEVHGKEWLEPLLRDADFTFFAEWMEMVRADLDPGAIPEFPAGVEVRRGQAADHDRVREIWTEAYGELADGPRTIAAHLEQASWLGVLEAEGDVIAFALNGDVEEASGRVITAAVHPDARGNQYGVAILSAAVYQLATRDARQAVITVRPDIPQALRTCRDAGFRPGRGGLEYRRSTDEQLLSERREARRQAGVKARFGGWR